MYALINKKHKHEIALYPNASPVSVSVTSANNELTISEACNVVIEKHESETAHQPNQFDWRNSCCLASGGVERLGAYYNAHVLHISMP